MYKKRSTLLLFFLSRREKCSSGRCRRSVDFVAKDAMRVEHCITVGSFTCRLELRSYFGVEMNRISLVSDRVEKLKVLKAPIRISEAVGIECGAAQDFNLLIVWGFPLVGSPGVAHEVRAKDFPVTGIVMVDDAIHSLSY